MNITEIFGRLHEWSKARQAASLTRRGIAVPASLLPAGAVPPTPPTPPPITSPNPTGTGGAPPPPTAAPAPAGAIPTTPLPAVKTGWRWTDWVTGVLLILVVIGMVIWIFPPGKEPSVEANLEVNQVNQRPPEVVLIKTLSTVEPVTENILDEYVDPRKWVGGELTTTKFVGPGNGKHFIKPEGWIIECTIWANKHDGTEYSSLINTNTFDAPVWIPNTNSTQIVSVRGFWVRYKGAADKLPPEGMKVTFALTPRTSP